MSDCSIAPAVLRWPNAANNAGRQDKKDKASLRFRKEVAEKMQGMHAAASVTLLEKFLYGISAIILIVAWIIRYEDHLVAKTGLGYGFGMVGGGLMLALFLYPLRKRVRAMRNWGNTRSWFKFHLSVGILSPVFIMLHTNFKLGSLNSRVVFLSTMMVVVSGVVGRYLYTKIHYGLYGKRMTLQSLQEDFANSRSILGKTFSYTSNMEERLRRFEAGVIQPSSGLCQSVARLLIVGIWKRWVYFRLSFDLRKALQKAAKNEGWSRRKKWLYGNFARKRLALHLNTVLRIVELSFYERLFSLWHIFHFPLFVLLVLTGIGHVLAVHMY